MKEKNYWPMAIICALLFGVFILSVSIVIALKNPIQDEESYLSSKRDVDERINDIIKEQNKFLHSYKPTFSFLDMLGHATELENFSFPYTAKINHPGGNKGEKQPTQKYLPHKGQLRVEFMPLKQPQESILSLRLFLDSFHQAKSLKELGNLLADSHKPFIYTSMPLELPFGRWKLILEITYGSNEKAYFEGEIFIEESIDENI